ncbi:MAG: hypothetical protein WEC75_03895 [Dehalococcoidia bacterium]
MVKTRLASLLGIVVLAAALALAAFAASPAKPALADVEQRTFCIKGESDGGLYRVRLTLPDAIPPGDVDVFTSGDLSLTAGSTANLFTAQFESTIDGFAQTGVTASVLPGSVSGWHCFLIDVSGAAGTNAPLTLEVTDAGGTTFSGSPVPARPSSQSFNPVITEGPVTVGGVAERPDDSTLALAESDSSSNSALVYGGIAAVLAVLLVAGGGLAVRRRRSQ